MSQLISDFTKQVIRQIKSVPKGKVATYGQIGQLAGRDKGARAVCQVLAQYGRSHDLPWFRIINSQGKIAFKTGTKHFKIQKGHLQKEGVQFVSVGRVDLSTFQWKKKFIKSRSPLEIQPTVEDVTRNLNEDFRDAWNKLNSFALTQGDQRVYASSAAIMFARDICYMFVRPKKSYIELVFFLNRNFDDPLFKSPYQVANSKWGYSFRLVHEDQIDEPLTDWLRESFECVSLRR